MIDPDAIARDERLTRIGAGRMTIRRIRDALASGSSFGMETTLSGHLPIAVMDDAVARGYRVSLIFIGTESVETNLQRIRDRVLLGGHDVPEPDVRRRYARGLRNLHRAVDRANDVVLYDNSETSGFTIIAISNETELLAVRPPPAWVGKAMITVSFTQ